MGTLGWAPLDWNLWMDTSRWVTQGEHPQMSTCWMGHLLAELLWMSDPEWAPPDGRYGVNIPI